MKPLPNRIAVYLAAAAALAGGLAPLIGNLDWTSTAGIAAGLGAISVVVFKWLDGWSKYERGIGPGVLPADELELDELDSPDEFDEATAEPIPPAAVAAAQSPEGTTLQPSPGTPASRTPKP